MIDEIDSLLEKLSNANSASGSENEVREIVKEEISEYVDKTKRDDFGNLICTKKGKENAPELMLAAHMDEIGLMVKHIQDDGYIRAIKLGGWFDQTLLNQRVVIHTEEGSHFGVIGCKPPHLMRDKDGEEIVKQEEMFIDVGAEDAEEAREMGIEEGNSITMDREYKKLNNNLVTGKSFDNRVGVACMILALKEIDTEATIHAVGTTQEEVGLKGAKVSTFNVDPDLGLALDVCLAGDQPDIEDKESSIELEKGPAFTVADRSGRGIITPKKVLDLLKKSAKKEDVSYQLDVMKGGTTDATAISLSRSGIPSGVLSIPTRNVHTPVEVVSLNDMKKGIKVLSRVLEEASDWV
ncbi:MAG: Peptidase M42 family protein [Candidatus Methanohalarchaeum thermophilum]|uniref:Peptidase M42 family protein n=1 Tax=Methanohalarchaeum thermophilum TaxID=1903181 RepID=A0A1Q6DX80_METT1|nr:MAG: Peptidase M42 family protein [Candidatus Methanohalarchaeum thermophilum]